MKKIAVPSPVSQHATPAVQRKSTGASLALGDSPRMVAQRKQLQDAVGSAQLAAKKDKKLKK